MAVLVIAELNGTQLATDLTAKTLTAAEQLGPVDILCAAAGCGAAAEAAAQFQNVTKVLCADHRHYGNGLAEPLAELIAGLASQYSHIVGTRLDLCPEHHSACGCSLRLYDDFGYLGGHQ